MKIRSRCEVDTDGESYVYEGRFKVVKRKADIPLNERLKTKDESITTYELFVERKSNIEGSVGFNDCRIYLDEKDIPEDLLKVLEKYCEKREV